MCTVKPLTLAIGRDRMPGGSVPLPAGGIFAISLPTVAARADPGASANPPAAAEAVATKSRRDGLSGLAVFSSEFGCASPGIWAPHFTRQTQSAQLANLATMHHHDSLVAREWFGKAS